MNKVILIGRLTKDPDYRQAEHPVASYTLAVDRRGKDAGADFIRCVTFGKGADFANMWLHKGTKICGTGRIQTGSYQNKEGKTVYTQDVIVDEHEFVESKAQQDTGYLKPDNGFVNIPEGEDSELPFK